MRIVGPTHGKRNPQLPAIYPILFLLAALLYSGLAAAQESSTPVVRTTTARVLLDFVVRDKHGQIIRDLKPGEVHVFEDGVPQPVRHFEFFNGNTETIENPAPVAGAPATANQPQQPMTVNELRENSVVSVVIANLDPRERALTLDTMKQFIKNELKPNVYVGVFTLELGGLGVVQTYTNNAEKISNAVVAAATSVRTGQIAGISLQSTLDDETPDTSPDGFAPPSAPGPTGQGSASAGAAAAMASLDTHWDNALGDAYQTSIFTLAPLHNLLQAQAAIPGRKVVLLFMSGLTMTQETEEAFQNLVSVANRSNVTIYAYTGHLGYGQNDYGRKMVLAAANASMKQQLAHLNGGDMTVTPTEAVANDIAINSIRANSVGNLATLAEDTGGALLHPSLDMREPLEEVMQSVQTHYELTYQPTNPAVDGSFRKIEVKVSRPGARVFARSGYFAVPLINGKSVYPFEIATLKAIDTRPEPHQFSFDAETLRFRQGTARNQLGFVFQMPIKSLTLTEDKHWVKAHVCITALIKDDSGQVVDKISRDIPYDEPIERKTRLLQGMLSFTAPVILQPGQYTLVTAAVDRNSMHASVNTTAFQVAPGSQFSMSDVTIARTIEPQPGQANPLNPFQARGATITPELGNTVSPAEDGTIRFYAVAYPPAPVDAPVSVSIILAHNGKPIMQSPPSPVPLDSHGAASILARFPAAKLPPGHYAAQVSFHYKGQTLSKQIAFTLRKGD